VLTQWAIPLKVKTLKEASLFLKSQKFRVGWEADTHGGTCTAAYRMFQATKRIADVASYETENNPVFIQLINTGPFNKSGKIGSYCRTVIRVGPNAISYQTFDSGNYRC
jgi:hypothetical protein